MKKFLKICLLFTITAGVSLAAVVPVVNMALSHEDLRNSLLQKLATSLRGTIEAESLSISLDSKCINISSNDLKGEILDGTLRFNLPSIAVKTGYAELLRGSFVPSYINAASPRIVYSGQPAYSPAAKGQTVQWTWDQRINSLLKKLLGRNASIDITDGILTLPDTSIGKIFMHTTPGRPETTVEMRAEIDHKGSLIPLEITGAVTTAFTQPFRYSFQVKAVDIPLTAIPATRDFYFSGGVADFTGILAGSRKGMDIDADIVVNNLDMSVGWTSADNTRHQEKKYLIERSTFEVKGGLVARKTNFPTLTLKSDDFLLQGSLVLDFTDGSNPFMDLRLQSSEMKLATLKMLLPDPLINDWTTRTIFPRLENGTARMTDFAITGTIEDIKKPGSDFLSWSGVLSNVDTFYNDHLPLARVQSTRLSMSGDKLEIAELSAEAGRSILSRGNLTISGLYDQSALLTTDGEGSFSLSWLTELARAGLFGESMLQMVDPVSTISGMYDGQISMSMTLGDRYSLLTFENMGTAVPMELTLNNSIFPVKMKTADLTLNYPGKSIIKSRGSWGKSYFNGTLSLIDLGEKKRVKLDIKPDVAELKSLFPRNRTISSLVPCIKTLPVHTDLTLEQSTLSGSGSLDFSKVVPVKDSAGCEQLLSENRLLQTDYRLKYSGNTLNIQKINLRTSDGNMQVTGKIGINKKSPLLIKEVRMTASDFPVQSLKILLPSENRYLNGTVSAHLESANSNMDTIWHTLNGRLKIKGWAGSVADSRLTVNNLDMAVKIDKGQVLLTGSNIFLKDFGNKSPLSLQAKLDKKDVWNGTVLLHGKNLDLTQSYTLFQNEKTYEHPSLPIGKIRIVTGVDHLRFRNLLFSPLLMESYITKDIIITSKMLLQLEDDFIWLTGDRQSDEVIYTSYFQVRKRPVNAFMALMRLNNDIITGDLDMEGKLTARVKPGKNFLETISGVVSFNIKQGTLQSSSTLIKILDLISLENIFDKKDIIKWKNKFNYKEISGIFNIDKGVCSTDALIMDADAFDIFSEGWADLLENTVNMQVKLAPFGTVNKIFSSIPFLGYILTGKTKSLFDYSFSLIGKIGSPEVKYTPLVDTVTSITGYVKRLVSGRKEIKQVINTHLKTDMARKESFIQRTGKELSVLHSSQ